MGAKNIVVQGDYKGKRVGQQLGLAYLTISAFKPNMRLDSNTVDCYEILNSETTKSAASAVGRAAVGSVLLGPVGLLAGVSAKNKGSHYIALRFKDGKKCLMNVDQNVFNAIIEKCTPAKSQIEENNSTIPSAADEILKFKNLLDQGIITQDEFDAKKKQLMNL